MAWTSNGPSPMDDDPSALTASVDVAFTTDLLAHLRAELCIDNLRVYATGMSNGAEMTSQLGCLLPADSAQSHRLRCRIRGLQWRRHASHRLPRHRRRKCPVRYRRTSHGRLGRPQPLLRWPGACHRLRARFHRKLHRLQRRRCRPLHRRWRRTHLRPRPEVNVPYGGDRATTHEIDASALIWAFFAAHPKSG